MSLPTQDEICEGCLHAVFHECCWSFCKCTHESGQARDNYSMLCRNWESGGTAAGRIGRLTALDLKYKTEAVALERSRFDLTNETGGPELGAKFQVGAIRLIVTEKLGGAFIAKDQMDNEYRYMNTGQCLTPTCGHTMDIKELRKGKS